MSHTPGGGQAVGVAREKRAALCALTISVMRRGVVTGAQFATILGLWNDLLLYRRAAYCTLDAAYGFAKLYATETRQVRVIPGNVVTEMLGLAALAPLLQTSLTAEVCETVFAVDASLTGTGVASTTLPQGCADELWRHRVRAGCDSAQPGYRGSRGLSFVGELADDLDWVTHSELTIRPPKCRRGRPKKLTINVCEGKARRRHLQRCALTHAGQRVLCVYDSTVTVHGAARGRAGARGLLREQRKAAAAMLAADMYEGALWTDSERNPGDYPSRGRPVPQPARARRAWTSAFLDGDVYALDGRLAELQAATPRAGGSDSGDAHADLADGVGDDHAGGTRGRRSER